MRHLAPFLAFTLAACSAVRSTTALHHPDLRLAALAVNSEGSAALFRSYRADGPVKWNQGWPWKLDLSGVAWDLPNTATVITPRHVVMASHYVRGAGQPIVFHDRSGRRHARVVQKVVKLDDRGLKCDVAVGLLDRPLPDSIRRYPLPAVREDGGKALIGATALVTEQKRGLYFHRIASLHAYTLGMRYDESFPAERRKSLVKGDSGHPSFILSKGELVLIETHTGGAGGLGPYYGSSALQEKLREVLRELDANHTFRTIEIDPPTLADAEAGRRAAAPPPQPAAPPVKPAVPPATPSTRPAVPSDEPRMPRKRVLPPPRS